MTDINLIVDLVRCRPTAWGLSAVRILGNETLRQGAPGASASMGLVIFITGKAMKVPVPLLLIQLQWGR